MYTRTALFFFIIYGLTSTLTKLHIFRSLCQRDRDADLNANFNVWVFMISLAAYCYVRGWV